MRLEKKKAVVSSRANASSPLLGSLSFGVEPEEAQDLFSGETIPDAVAFRPHSPARIEHPLSSRSQIQGVFPILESTEDEMAGGALRVEEAPMSELRSLTYLSESHGLLRHGRGKSLILVLLITVISILAAYVIFSPFGINPLIRVSQSDRPSHSTQNISQLVIPAVKPSLTPSPTSTPIVSPPALARFIPTPTPILTPTPPLLVPISLSSYVNNAGIGSTPGKADLDGSGYSFPADQLPRAGQVIFNGVPYLFPGSASGVNNNVVALGQTISFSQGHYQKAFLLVTSTWGSAGGAAVVNYTDGTTSAVRIGAPDWLAGGSFVAVRTSYRYSPTGIDNSVSYIYGVQIAMDGTKIASSLTLPSTAKPSPNQSSLHVFALTLQSA